MERLLLAVCCTLVHIPPVFIRYAPFRELVDPRRKQLLFALYAAILLLVGASYYIFGESHTILTHKLMLITVAFLLSAVNVLAVPGHWREHWFTAGLASVHISVTFFGCAYAMMRLGIAEPVKMVAYSSLLTFAIFVLLRRYYINSARRVVTPFLKLKCGDYWKRIWYIPLPMFFASFFSAPMDSYAVDPYALACRFFILISTILMCNAIAQDHGHMRHRLDLAEQLNIQQDYYRELTDRVNEARKTRHDFKHHLAAVRRYIDSDDKSGLTKYWEELQDYVSQGSNIPYTGNAALDGVLYRYSLLAKQQGVQFHFSGVAEPLEMPGSELSVLLGNALDNALAGCMTVKTGRSIAVDMRVDRDEQSILIRNSFDGVVDKEGSRFLSRKRSHEAGIGLESMASICEKNGCLMDIRYDETTFSVLLVLKIKR